MPRVVVLPLLSTAAQEKKAEIVQRLRSDAWKYSSAAKIETMRPMPAAR